METLQIQSAGATAPTLSASTAGSDAPTREGSFALTLGRALQSLPGWGQDGSAIALPTSPASPRAKGADDDDSSSSVAGMLLNCLVTNVPQPPPSLDLNVDVAGPAASVSNAQSTAGSTPTFALSLNLPAGETSTKTGTISTPGALGGVPVPSTFTGAGKGAWETGIATAETLKSASTGKDQGGAHSGKLVPATGQDRLEDSSIPQPTCPPSTIHGLPVTSLPGLPVKASTGVAQSEWSQAPISNQWSTPGSEPRQGVQVSPSLKDSWPSPTTFNPAQIIAAPQLPIRQGLPATSHSQAVPEPRQGTQGSPEFTDSWSSLPLFNPAPMEAAPRLPMSQGFQTGSNFNFSLGTSGQAAPTFAPMTGNASTPPSATGHLEWADDSSPLGGSGKTDGQVASDPNSSGKEVGPAAPLFSAGVNESSYPVPVTGLPDLSDLSSLLGEFAATGASVKLSGAESQQARVTEKLTAKGTPAAPPPGGSSGAPTPESVSTPPATKPEGPVNIPAHTPIHSSVVSGTVGTEGAWQKGNETEATSVPTPPSPPAVPELSTPLVANSPSAPPAAPLEKDAALETNSFQAGGAVYASSGGSGGSATLTDSSTTGQGKSGQQNGTMYGGASVGVTTSNPSPNNNPATESAVNLVAPHAASIPMSPTGTPAPPASPSSPHAPATLSAWQNYDGGAGSIVRSAALSSSANGAEMHVEFRSGNLGPVEVRTVVNAGSVGAEIHVQGQEAHTLLAASLPSLERALGERNLRVENIAVYQDHPGSGMSGGEKQNPQSGSHPSGQQQVLPWDRLPHSSRAASGPHENEESANPGAGLSVRA